MSGRGPDPPRSALGQPRLLFLLSRLLFFWAVFFVSSQPGTHLPDRRDENELPSSLEGKIRERHGGKLKEIKQK